MSLSVKQLILKNINPKYAKKNKMVVIKFKINGEEKDITFSYDDTSKTVREMILSFVKSHNSYLQLKQEDKSKFEETLSTDLLTFVLSNKIVNSPQVLNKKVGEMFKKNNLIVRIIDSGDIIGGN